MGVMNEIDLMRKEKFKHLLVTALMILALISMTIYIVLSIKNMSDIIIYQQEEIRQLKETNMELNQLIYEYESAIKD